MQYTLSQLLQIAKNIFNEMFYESSYLFVAEVVKCKQSKKYVYIDCIEYDESWDVKARCTLCVFQEWLIENFFQQTWLTMHTIVWQKILCSGRLSLYEDRLSIILDMLHVEYSLGQLQKSQKIILNTLVQEWIINQNRQTILWFPPYNIAIISARQAEWLEDFYTILNEAKIPYKHTLYESIVHGNTAKESVYKTLQIIYSDIKNWASYNVICIIRWWGDMAWMLRQNDIDIARWICHMPIPVIVAVWHTNDATVLDQVCFEVANTPTAAAHYLINQYHNICDDIHDVYNNIEQKYEQKIQLFKEKIAYLTVNIMQGYTYTLTSLSDRIANLYAIISLYHPQNIINKWYAIIRSHDTILWDALPLIGEKLSIETKHYHITTTVESVATKE